MKFKIKRLKTQMTPGNNKIYPVGTKFMAGRVSWEITSIDIADDKYYCNDSKTHARISRFQEFLDGGSFTLLTNSD